MLSKSLTQFAVHHAPSRALSKKRSETTNTRKVKLFTAAALSPPSNDSSPRRAKGSSSGTSKKVSKNALKKQGKWQKGRANYRSSGSTGGSKAGFEIQTKLTQSNSLDELFEVVREFVDQFDAINASTALHRIASKGTREFEKKLRKFDKNNGESWMSTARAGRRMSHDGVNRHPYEQIIRNSDFDNLMQVVEDNLGNMDVFGLANVAWSLATLKVFEKNDWGNVEGGKDERGTEMLDTIASNFAKCVTIQGGANVRPQAFSNLIWAYGNVKYKISDDDGVLSRIYSQCETSWVENADAWKPQEMANLLVGVAHGDNATDRWSFYEKLQNCAVHNLKLYPIGAPKADMRFAFSSRDISNFLWGLSKSLKSQRFNAQSIDPELISLMLNRLVADNFGGSQSALNISMTVWALANCKCQVPTTFMNALNREIPRMAKRLSTSQLDAIAWSIGEARQTLKYDNDAIDTIAEAIADKRDSMYNESDPELVAKTFWALSRRGRIPADGSIIDKLVRKVETCADDLERADKLLVLHAWGVLRISPGEKIVNKLVRTFLDEDEDEELEPDECAKLLCAYGRINHRPSSSSDTGSDFEAHLENLAKTLADSAEASRLNPGTLALGLWGCALLKLDLDEDVLDALARDAIRQTEALRPNAFAKCIWALSTLAYDPTQEDLAKLMQKAQATILSPSDVNDASQSTRDEVEIALKKLGAGSFA